MTEPHWTDFEDSWDEEPMDFDDCPYGSGGMPQLGVEDCEFGCDLSTSCQSIYASRKDCILFGRKERFVECWFFHYGKCYIDMANYEPSRLKALWWRFRCAMGRHPTQKEVLKT